MILIKSHAGAGRTVFLKRLAWETATTNDRLCLYLEPDTEIDIEHLSEVFRLTKCPIHIFVDGLSERVNAVDDLIRSMRHAKWPAILFVAERNHEWNDDCDPILGKYVDEEYELDRLTSVEIASLITKLETHKCLGELARLSPEERLNAFLKTYDGQLLVSLHEATHGRQFGDIIMDEYQSIGSDKARLLYLDICSLHRFGVPVRAGLVSRVHDISFHRFQKDFLRPLEKIVSVTWTGALNDYVYAARHRIIAELVYQSNIITPDEKFDNLVRLISKLNPAYSYDVEVLNKIIHFSNLAKIDLSIEKGSYIYDIALREFGEQPFIFHQAACFLNARATSLEHVDRASAQLGRALDLNETNQSFRHTEAEIALKRSRVAKTEAERTAARNRAVAIAKPISEKSKTAHAFHTIVKARIDALKDALAAHDWDPGTSNEDVVTAAIQQAQQDITRGLRTFTGDSRLLTSQSELYALLANNSAAVAALEKAFTFSPQSVLVAKRLAAAYEARDDFDIANDVLLRCLEHNIGNHELHSQIGMNYTRKMKDRADKDALRSANFHLSKALQSGDKRHDERLWYARGLFLESDAGEARNQFAITKAAQVSRHTKELVRGVVRDASGPITYIGEIVDVTHFRGFIRCKDLAGDVFVFAKDMPPAAMHSGKIITFSLGFNYFGPVATEIEPNLI